MEGGSRKRLPLLHVPAFECFSRLTGNPLTMTDLSLTNLKSQLAVTVAQHSSAGVKPRNEDSIAIQIPQDAQLTTKGIVAAIADGVSAAEAGREASEIAVKGFINDYYSTPDSWSVKQSAHKVLIALNRWLYGQGQKFLEAEKGYVTTFSALILKSQAAYVFHVGDSRIYRLRDGALQQLLLDGERDLDALAQTLVQTALDNGSTDNLSCQLVRIRQLGQETNEDVFRTLHQLPFPPDLSVGMKLDGWRVQQQLHASTRSQLYVVQHEASGQRAVMKTPSRNFIDDPAYIERFLIEEWVGRRIDSSYVVKVVEPPAARTFLYYLTEFVEGPTLAQWIAQRKTTDVTTVVALAEKLAQGLRAFHRRETLHQDIKPDNVVLRGEDPVIIDFGSVYVAGVDEIATTFAREQALGTLDYSAPEYRLQRPRTPAGDQFSLAVVLYELLTGQAPFGEAYQKALKPQDFLALKYVPAFRRNPLVPLWMDGALRKALQINAELRYESLSEFIHDLKNPNPVFLKADQRPLLEKDPVRFWKGLSVVLLVLNVILLAALVV